MASKVKNEYQSKSHRPFFSKHVGFYSSKLYYFGLSYLMYFSQFLPTQQFQGLGLFGSHSEVWETRVWKATEPRGSQRVRTHTGPAAWPGPLLCTSVIVALYRTAPDAPLPHSSQEQMMTGRVSVRLPGCEVPTCAFVMVGVQVRICLFPFGQIRFSLFSASGADGAKRRCGRRAQLRGYDLMICQCFQ